MWEGKGSVQRGYRLDQRAKAVGRARYSEGPLRLEWAFYARAMTTGWSWMTRRSNRMLGELVIIVKTSIVWHGVEPNMTSVSERNGS